MLLQNEERGANQFRSFVGSASVQQDDEEDSDHRVETDGADGYAVGLIPAMFVIAAGVMG